MPTSVPATIIGPAGVLAPQAADVLAGVWQDLAAAFGGDLNTTNLETPEGQLASSLTAIITDKNDQFRSYVAGVDPAFAAGRLQDGIARIYFISRDPARPTTVQSVLTGLTGTVIPAGTQAKAGDGSVYVATASGTIGQDGTVTLPFACLITGPIPCPAATLSRPYGTIPGWDSITNPAPGVLGNDVETPRQFEARRAASVALNAQGSLPAVQAAVLSVPNVLDAYVAENVEAAPATVNGVLLPEHSLYVAAVGGDPAAVARAIWTRKAPGCNTFGNIMQVVTDSAGYDLPYPSYPIRFQVPAAVPVLVAVVLASGPDVPSDAATQVQKAVIRAFAGADGGSRARVAATLYASRFYGPVAALGPWARVVSIEIGTQAPTGFSLLLPMNQTPVVSPANITVSVA